LKYLKEFLANGPNRDHVFGKRLAHPHKWLRTKSKGGIKGCFLR